MGRGAALKSVTSFCQVERICRFYDCFAAERGQAPSPQVLCAPLDRHSKEMSIDGRKAVMSQDRARSIKPALWAAIGLCCLVFAHHGLAGDLPPAPSGMEAIVDAQLFLELVVNQMNTGRVIAVEQRGGRFFVPVAVLRETGMKLPQELSAEIALDSLQGLHSDYDSQGQRLLLTVPPDWLPEQFVGSREAYPRTAALSSFGALLNYDLYLNDTDDSGTE